MSVTVADVLKLPIMSDVYPVAGLDRLSNSIRWVHVMGVPEMARWIRGGELLLASGYLWPRRPREQCALVDKFASAGLSALVMNIGELYPEIPRHLVETADSRHLPLLACPWTKPFVDMAEAVQREILRSSLSVTSPSGNVLRALIEVSIRRSGLIGLAEHLATLVENRIAIEDDSFRLLALADPSLPDQPGALGEFHGISDRIARDPALARRLETTLGPVQLIGSTITDLPDAVICPIRGEQTIYGYLSVVATRVPLSPFHVVAAEHGARVAGLELAKNRIAPMEERRLADKLIVGLLKGQFADRRDREARATILGLTPGGRHLLALLEAGNCCEALPARLRLHLAGEGLQPIVAAIDNRVAMVFHGHDVERSDLSDVLASLVQDGGELLPAGSRVAMGHVTLGLEGIGNGYQLTLASLELGARFLPWQRMLRHEDLRVYRLLDAAGDRMALDDFSRDVLGPLARPKSKFERDLRMTIDVLVENRFSQVDAARALFLHKNSMRYRLRKIEEATGLVLTRHDHTHQLQLAVEADRLLSAHDTTRPD